ncbi:MAG TPA: type II toxin-antitoxin system VapC family toxin [Burkholderiaceae bacterium]|nr:type II toxin-antitoxin system VapC family toxin [Burkholderiaceae bacterium]
MKFALDTNLLVRLLTNDAIAQAARVEAWLVANATPQFPAYVDHVVLCELGWVLQRSYAYSRSHVRDAIAALLEYDVLGVESPALVRQALEWFAIGPADFSDCLLAARARAAGCETVLTLDRKAAKTATHRLLP